LRNTIEGLNGYAKDPAHQALAQPARRRVRGIAAQSIFTALLLIAVNIRKIRAWRALTTATRPGSHGGHDGAGPACATTSLTANTRNAPSAATDHRQPARPPPATRNGITQVRGNLSRAMQRPTARCQTPAAYSEKVTGTVLSGMKPAVLSVTHGVSEGIRTPDIQDHNLAL
jgi:hypothetical protein